ncbi:HAMP domain-containing histidine kinase [Candidatus Daviesbacteria bacterium]|nr:HAMP domain-containing histidine kinase [Candidatus Daviesbacteria bacterium]
MKSPFKDLTFEDLKSIFLTYGFAIATGIGAYIIDRFFESPHAHLVIFSIFILAITLSSAYGGLRAGLLTTIITTLEGMYILPPGNSFLVTELSSITQILMFVLNGLLISLVIEKFKKTDMARDYREKEKRITQIMTRTQQEFTKAQAEIKARDEFLSFASHELKTPLTTMLLQIQTILHNIKNVSLANFSVQHLLQMLENAEAESKQLSKMINDLLNVSLITTGRLDLKLEEVDLSKLVKDITDRFSQNLKQKNYSLSLEAQKPVKVQLDKLRIEQVVTNLISNAIKYGESKPINIKVTNSGSSGKVIITDQGIGIPLEQKDKIFAKFERAANSSKYQGLGIGLYITAQIIKAHNGKINVESKPNKGSIFTVELPLKQPKKS